jgi:hypothetical protein
LVVGLYQPLADNPGIAPESDQTRSLQSDQRTILKSLGKTLIVAAGFSQVISKGYLFRRRLKRKGPGA